jgi:hypothetical protein
MKTSPYARARDTVSALNRLRRRSAKLRKGESKSHFDRDRATVHSLWFDPNILGFGVGPKISDGLESDFSLIFFVRKKLPRGRLRNLVKIPKYLVLQSMDLRVATDVQEWGGVPIAHGPLTPGVPLGDANGNSGTMALGVRDRSSGAPLILSCSHVLAQCGRGHRGDDVESPPDLTADPGPNIVGQLFRFTIIDPSSQDNEVDAAVARPNDGIQLSNVIPGRPNISGARDLTKEDENSVSGLGVQKFGACTGLQTGTIRNLHISTSIVYHQLSGDPSVDFVELVEYDCVSQEGDSGAAVLDTADPARVVGMHIAGGSDGTTSLFTHIQYVFDSMQVNM